MRTTLALDPDIVEAARTIARVKGISMGAAVSELARRGLEQERSSTSASLLHFLVLPGARSVTLDDVKSLEDEA